MILLFVSVLIALSGCEQDILKPALYSPGNAIQRPLFITTDLLSADGSFTTGYRNYNIRADQINLSWKAATDDNFLCYRLFRNNVARHTFNDINRTTFTDGSVVKDTRYLYTIATILKSGMSKSDTLSIKTASLAAPVVYSRVNQDNSIKIMWQDRSDIPGSFELFVDGTLLATIPEFAEYSYIHTTAQHNVQYTYTVQKKGLYSNSDVQTHSVYNNYVMTPPQLTGHQNGSELSVNLSWTDDCTSQTGYKVYRRAVGVDADFVMIRSITSPIQTTYTDSNDLQLGTTYKYAVKAVDTVNDPIVETGYSNTVSILLREQTTLNYNFDNGLMPGNFDSWGDAPWYITTKPGSRNYCIRSGVISDDEYSGVDIELSIPNYASVTVDFDYYVSSESYYDCLYFYCSDGWYGDWSGNTGWQHFTHTYTYNTDYGWNGIGFEYEKDESVSSGLDCAMIDNLSISYVENGDKKYVTLGGE
jgi:hypothetical protein